jgi:hypothetical protein
LIFIIAAFALPMVAQEKKLKPEQVVSKHLESIGKPEAHKAVTSRMTSGESQVIFRLGGQGTLTGQGNILSEGQSVRMGMRFSALEYPGEQIAYDGKDVGVAQISPGTYSPLASFIRENDLLVKEGLLFGALSTSWALLDVAGRRPRLNDAELKKVDGRLLYEMKYQPRRGTQIQAWFFFEPETFRHVRSLFRLTAASSRIVNITDSAEQVRYQITEEFDEFKEVDGLTLPHSYKLDYSIDSPRGASLTSWMYLVREVVHNSRLERQLFSVQ